MSLLVDCSIPEDADPALFDFHSCSWQLPRAFLHASGGSAMAMFRTREVIASRPNSQMALYLSTKGQVTSNYDGLIQEHVPGDIVVVDYSLPYDSRASDYEGIILTFDKAHAPAGLQHDAHGLVLTANESAGAMLRSQMTALVDNIDGLSVELSQMAVDGILQFAASAVSTLGVRERREKNSLFQRASAIARQNLADPDFGPDELAIALHISRSKLFRLFEPHGGVQRWMLADRLRNSLQSIVRSPSNPKISAVARNHGFRSEAHYSRVFQKRYQISPSSVYSLFSKAAGTTDYQTLMDHDSKHGATIIETWLASAHAPAALAKFRYPVEPRDVSEQLATPEELEA